MRSLLLVIVPSLAAAAPATTLTMQRADSTNLHIADERGAIHWDEDATVVVELRANATVVASVVGKRAEHNLYASAGGSYDTDDVTTWKAAWTGTFKRTADALVLELALGSETCARTKTTHDDAHTVPPEQLACRHAAKRTTVSCTTTQLELEAPGGGKPTRIDAWSCTPKTDDDLGESPAWLFGKSRCLRVGGGHMTSTSFSACSRAR